MLHKNLETFPCLQLCSPWVMNAAVRLEPTAQPFQEGHMMSSNAQVPNGDNSQDPWKEMKKAM